MTAHAYWRLYITQTETAPYATLAEVEFRATAGGATQTTGGTPVYSGQFNTTSDVAVNAFDGNLATIWSSSNVGTPYIGYHFASAVSVEQVRVVARNETNGVVYGLRVFVVQSSDDGTNWTEEWSVRTPTWAQGESRLFNRPAAASTSVSQLGVEVMRSGGATAKLSQLGAEVMSTLGTYSRLSQLGVEVMRPFLPPSAGQRITVSLLS